MASPGARPVHKVRATSCGQAKRADGLTASWREVTCRECLKGAPSTIRACFQCGKPVSGPCAFVRAGGTAPDHVLHDTCVPAFRRSPRGRSMAAADPNLMMPHACRRCGRFGPDHDEGMPGCR